MRCHGSDLNLLVDALPGATRFDPVALRVELDELSAIPVDLHILDDLPPRVPEGVLSGAGPV